MHRFYCVSLVIFTVVFSIGSILPTRGQSQNEMNAQAQADFDKADKELNTVYQQILKTMDDDITRQKLVAAQKAWLKFRDAQGEFEADEMRGGSAEPLLLFGSYTRTTNVRIAELKQWLADQNAK